MYRVWMFFVFVYMLYLPVLDSYTEAVLILLIGP